MYSHACMYSHARISFYGRICFLLLLLGFVFSMVNATGGTDLLTITPEGGSLLPNVTPTTPAAMATVTPALTTMPGVSPQNVPVPENADTCSGGSCTISPTTYPLMHLTKAQLDEEERQFQSMEKYSPKRMAVSDKDLGGTGKSLLSYISYVPSERNQGGCGDCWVWASTGVLEVEHAVKTGVNERLSTQYFNSKYNNGQGADYACCGGNLQIFSSWYGTDKSPIPWSNTNAGFGDRNTGCGGSTAVPIGTISTTPHYQLNSLSYSYVATSGSGISQSTAIANIKNAIDNNKAVYYSFHYGTTGWSAFNNFWGSQAESVIFNPDSYGGQADAGGHAVLIVGYDTSDAANPYWIVLNSWGAPTLRPNDLFRLKMNMNYDNVYLYGSTPYVAHRFLVLDSTFQNSPPTISSITPANGLNSTSVFITNLAGTGFYGTPAVKLNRTGYADIVATEITVVSPTNITCTFPISGKPTGQYNVVVANPDGQQSMLVNGFTVMVPTPDKIGTYQNGVWHLDYSRNGTYDGAAVDRNYYLGGTGNRTSYGDWNGDGKTEVGVFNSGTWYLDYNGNGVWDGPSTDRTTSFGQAGDIPIVGDWNGNGKDKIGFYRNGLWAVDYNGNYTWDGPATDRSASFGGTGTIPVIGDWNGDGKDKIGFYQTSNSLWAMDYNGNYVWDGVSTDRAAVLGATGAIPVIGDWSGDGKAKLGFFANALWAFDYNGNYGWDGMTEDRAALIGQTGDVPVIGDWNGSGRSKLGFFRSGLWSLDYNGNFTWDGPPADKVYLFCQADDTPVVGKWS